MTTQIGSLLTVTDLDAMPDDGNRYELIEGELLVSRAPTLEHQIVIANLIAVFDRYLTTNPIGLVAPGPGIIFDKFNAVMPDIIFLTNERRAEISSAGRLTGAPDIVVEVLSPGTANEKRDRERKRRLYGQQGVKEYWIVDRYKRVVEFYHANKRDLELSQTFGADDELISPVLPGFKCKVSELFKRL